VTGGDVQEHQLVGTGLAVSRGQFHRVTRVAQVQEVDALDHPAIIDIQTRDDTDCNRHPSSVRVVLSSVLSDWRVGWVTVACLCGCSSAPLVAGVRGDQPVWLVGLGVGVAGDAPAVQIDFAVMAPADQDELVEVGASAFGPGGHMVGLAFGGWSTAQDAPAVAHRQGDALGSGGESLRATDGEWFEPGVGQCPREGLVGSRGVVDQDGAVGASAHDESCRGIAEG